MSILAIYDNEIEYANRLMEYIKRKKKYSNVRVFTNESALVEYSKSNIIDILLIGENLNYKELKGEKISNICLLTEDKTNLSSDNSYPTIFKYQSVKHILKELFDLYPIYENAKSSTDKESEVTIISIFSMEHSSSRQIHSLAVAKQSSITKKTLYVNLSSFPTLAELRDSSNSIGLSEFIYYLKQNHSNLALKMKENTFKKYNIDILQGLSFSTDLFELTPEDINLWIQNLNNSCEYEVVIFDLGILNQATLELLIISKRIEFLRGDTELEKLTCMELKKQLTWAGYQELTDKFNVIPLTKNTIIERLDLRADEVDALIEKEISILNMVL